MWCSRPIVVIALATSVALPGACTDKGKGSPAGQDSVRRMYYEAMEELVDGNYLQATQLFNRVARSPRYVSYAPLARLRVGDALYLQSRYEEAIEVYRAFMAQYESNPNIPYARFRIASAYFQRIPSEWFASPPAYEIDQTMTREAVRELKGFIDTFPTSRFAPEAREMLAEARKMLFDFEIYAADFYESREKWRAMAWRLRHAIEAYPEYALKEDYVIQMAEGFEKAGDRGDAARAYALYLEKFPKGEQKALANERLEVLQATPRPTP